MIRIIIETIAAFYAAYGFGLVFNIKGDTLKIAGIGGAIGWFVYKVLITYTSIADPAALFLAGVSFSVYCEMCARIFLLPTTILSACALIVLVPGFGVYKTIYEFIMEKYITAGNLFTETLAAAGALALSVIFVTSIFRNVNIRRIISSKFEKNDVK
ncbi:threonine/serine exporter [Peptacetobacter hominis]|uniref:Threonine/serine exporter n=1 Tax=Peptacetobacter hominis TaxID=2743610 RepID=A0A544QUK7_9FIRM|nr:threonine/serine exporter family protein [Peptacetobacter hominis]TQQ84364.1 threonine/serine exporter [Peptacetobacter hominis]